MLILERIIDSCSKNKEKIDDFDANLLENESNELNHHRKTHKVSNQLRQSALVVIIGLVFHCVTDGFALGAAGVAGDTTLEAIIFFAMFMHKLPASFGFSSFLVHENYTKCLVAKATLVFSSASPLTAIVTYFILKLLTNSNNGEDSSVVCIALLISGGTFLYAATIHILPEVYCRSDTHIPHEHSHFIDEHIHGENHNSKYTELASVLIGLFFPFLITFLNDEH